MNMWLVGAGYWGSKLLGSLKKFDVDAKVIDIRNGQTIDDIDTLDPVMLATPLWQHHEQACELLKRGHDVYVEKPMAETYNQISDIGSCVTPGQLLMVGHIFVHHPQMIEIKAIIDSGAIGQLIHISSRRLNWGIYQTKTDPLLSLATHDISIVLDIVGTHCSIQQAQAWNYSNNTQPDRVWFSGICNNKVTFDIDVSWHWPVRTRQTIIMGTLGQITWDQDANTITTTGNQIQDRRAIADTNPCVIEYSHSLTPLEAELKHWVDCVQNRQEPTTGLDAAKAVASVIDRVKQLL
jgi:predicted dehydrogenase